MIYKRGYEQGSGLAGNGRKLPFDQMRVQTGRSLSTFFPEITVVAEGKFKRAGRCGECLMDSGSVVDGRKSSQMLAQLCSPSGAGDRKLCRQVSPQTEGKGPTAEKERTSRGRVSPAITTYCRLGGQKGRNALSHGSGVRESEIEGSAWSVSGEIPLPHVAKRQGAREITHTFSESPNSHPEDFALT